MPIIKKLHFSGKPSISLQHGGAILLRKGGPGAGSSYSSPEQYHDITGNGLYAQPMGGRGLAEKLSKLSVRPVIGSKIKNIRF